MVAVGSSAFFGTTSGHVIALGFPTLAAAMITTVMAIYSDYTWSTQSNISPKP